VLTRASSELIEAGGTGAVGVDRGRAKRGEYKNLMLIFA